MPIEGEGGARSKIHSAKRKDPVTGKLMEKQECGSLMYSSSIYTSHYIVLFTCSYPTMSACLNSTNMI